MAVLPFVGLNPKTPKIWVWLIPKTPNLGCVSLQPSTPAARAAQALFCDTSPARWRMPTGGAGVGANPQVRRSWGSGVFWGIPARGFRLSDPTGSTAEHRRAVVFNSGQPARLMGRRRWPKRPSEVDPGPRTGTPHPPEDSRTKTKGGGDAWDGTGI